MEAFAPSLNATGNITVNFTSFGQPFELSPWIKAAKMLRNVCIPSIAAIGILGNTLSYLVFSSKSMKKSSCSVFLASLAFVDCLFLLCLVITWLDGELKGIVTTDIACQSLIFITNVTSFLSVWFIVGFTCERLVAICLTFKRAITCSVVKEKKVVAITVLISFALYNYSFWTSGMQEWDSKMKCSHKMTYFRFLEIITWVDTFLTMVIPFILISVMNFVVLKTVFSCQLRQGSVHGRSSISLSYCLNVPRDSNVTLRESNTNSNLLRPNLIKATTQRKVWSRSNPKVRVTRTLLFVSMTFLCLNLPSHAVRLFNLISSVVTHNALITEKYFFLQEVTLMFYYLTFSCNFFLYTFFGRNFKTSLCTIFKCVPIAARYNARYKTAKVRTKGVTCL